ncbi:MAG: AI-2E family transporter [Actinobacteria bacterium]|nr:AI-2E family transporter [Actinomycetota bacterium]
MAGGETDPQGLSPLREWRTTQIVRVTAVATLTVLAIVGVLQFLFEIRTILLWVLIGVILAVALQPAVGWLERHRWNRIAAALLVSFGAIAVLVGVIVAVAYPVVFQADDFIRALPSILDELFGTDGQLNFLETRFHILERVARVTPDQVADLVLGNQETIVGVLSRAASMVAGVITILTIMVMMLIEGPRGWAAVLSAMVDEEREWGERVGRNFLRATGGYVRGNLAISLVAGIASYIVLRILGIPYAETLAVLVAVLDIIPLVGATIGAVIVSLVGFATGGAVDGIVLVVFFVVYQQFENNVLQNIVYSKTVSLSPLVVFIAALAGAALGGIVGVLLAIPLTSAGWVLAGDLIALRRQRSVRRGGREPLVKEPPPRDDETAQPGDPQGAPAHVAPPDDARAPGGGAPPGGRAEA